MNRFEALIVANAVLFLALGVTFMGAWIGASAKPKPIYGDWKVTVGRQVSVQRIYSYFKNYYVLKIPPWVPKEKYANLTFVRTELYLGINASANASVGIGMVEQLLTTHQAIKEYIYFRPVLNLKMQSLTFNLSCSRKLLPQKYTLHAWTQTVSYKGERINVGCSFQEYPAVWYPASASASVNFTFKEIWKYTPVVGYDDSYIQLPLAVMDFVKSLIASILATDFIVGLVLVRRPKE